MHPDRTVITMSKKASGPNSVCAVFTIYLFTTVCESADLFLTLI